MSGKGKATQAEVNRRVDQAAVWLMEHPDSGYTDFVSHFMPIWDIQRDTCHKYKKKALAKIGAQPSTDIESAKRLAIASMTNMLDKAMKEGDLKLAFQIRQEINKVTGAHAPVRTEVVQKEDRKIFNIDMSDVNKLKKVD